MTSLQRYFLIALLLHIGCFALDQPISELEYEEDELRLFVGKYSTDPLHVGDANSEDNDSTSDAISFHPSFYDFKESPVGIPRLGAVRIENRLKDEKVNLISISGNSINFHSSFFADKTIGPGNSTSFEVVFLSRDMGQFDSDLFIHTNKGLFKYNVRGVGLPNPYRLRPLIGAKIPVNATYEPIITLHNPHDTRIVVVEMLSSGTDFGLKLPDDHRIEEGAPWSIEPFQTKPVMQGSFQSTTEGNHTGFIRIKVNNTDAAAEYLMVPVEVQVTSSPGLYSPQELLDFGLMVRSVKPKTLSLSLINAHTSPVNIQTVTVKREPNPAIRIEFRPIIVEPGVSAPTVVALITFDPTAMANQGQANGFIEVTSECGMSIVIPFSATVLEGELEYNTSSLGFYVNADTSQPRKFSVRNKFDSAVAIYQCSVNNPDVILVESSNQSHVIPPGEQDVICTLKVQKKLELCDPNSPTQLTIKSNVTNLKLPITCYDGKLQLYTSENGQVDFGRVELYSSHVEYISVQNKNPIEIRLKSWGSNFTWGQVELVGMQHGVMEDLTRIRDFDNLKKSLFLQPGYMAVFSVEIRRPSMEGIYFGEVYVTTDQNQTLRAPFKFTVSKGSLTSEKIYFDKVFPGKMSSERLYLTSTFNHTLNLVGFKPFPPSSVSFTSSSISGQPDILPHRRTLVGKVLFDPKQFCLQDCYAGFSLDSNLGKEWAKASSLNWDAGESDLIVLEALERRFKSVKDDLFSNISMLLDTSGPSGFKIKAQFRYTWPRFIAQKSLQFPITSVGNTTYYHLDVQNPTRSPVVIHAVMAQDYGSKWVNFIPESSQGGNITEGKLVFSVKDVSDISSSQAREASDFKSKLLKYFPDRKEPTKGSFFIIPPRETVSLTLSFSPLSNDMSTSLVLLRNNLTGIESVWLKGRAGTGQLTVGNGAPGSSLLFQLTENLLQSCDKEMDASSKYTPSQLTVRRSFIARNIGEIPVEIVSTAIFPLDGSFSTWFFGNSQPDFDGDICEGHGFRVLNCNTFTLMPNQTHSIDIAFTPDFTLSKVRSLLRLIDSGGGHYNYTMIALIPSSKLAICAASLARPWWEFYLKIGALLGSVIIFLVACLALYFEASTVLSKTIFTSVRILPRGAECYQEEIDKTKKLDLKAEYMKVDNRFRRNQPERPKATTPPIQNSKVQQVPVKQPDPVPVTLRNRKGKKGPGETAHSSSAHNGLSNKSMEKLTQDSSRASSDPVEDSKEKENISVSNNNSFTKKKKGSASNTSAPLKHKKASNKNETNAFTSKKSEEETSSTTTESSNPDDLPSYPETSYKERNKGTTSAGSSTDAVGKGMKKEKNYEANVNGNTQSFNKAFMAEKSSEDKKRNRVKRKDSMESAVLNTENVPKYNGTESPGRSDPALWDTPRPPSGDGLSELSAQTEAFVMNRPSKRHVLSESGRGNANVEHNHVRNRIPAGMSYQNTIPPHYQFGHSQQLRSKPGVIGQRSGHSQGSFPQHPYTNMMANHPHLNYHYANGPMTTPSRPLTAPSNDSIWQNNLMTDNGCEAWGRRNADSSTSAATYQYNIPPDTANRPQSNLVYPNAHVVNPSYGQMTGIGPLGTPIATSYAMANTRMARPHSTSFPTSTGTTNGTSSTVGPAVGTRTRDTPFLFGGPSGEFISNPWQINSPNLESAKKLSHFSYGTRQEQIDTNLDMAPTGSTSQHHSFVQRMRSDPVQGSSPTSRSPWSDAIFNENDRKEELDRKAWNSSIPSSVPQGIGTTPLGDWKAVGAPGSGSHRFIGHDAQIWESGTVGSGRWPSTFEPQSNESVGGGTCATAPKRLEESKPILSSLEAANSSDIRELEAGLGFNPFASDIWNHSSDSSANSWERVNPFPQK